jgi:anti-anti-sigma factor
MSDATPSADVYALPGEMTIPHAAEVRDALLHAVGVGQALFDAQAVESIDSSGIQLLLALSRSLSNNSVSLQLTSPSSVLLDALRLYGLGDLVQTQH